MDLANLYLGQEGMETDDGSFLVTGSLAASSKVIGAFVDFT